MVDENDLEYEDFEKPVVFKVYPESEEIKLTPTFEVSQLLENKLGLQRGENLDRIGDFETKEDYFAFDSNDVVLDSQKVLSKVRKILESYNYPSLEEIQVTSRHMTEKEAEEYRDKIHERDDVKIDVLVDDS